MVKTKLLLVKKSMKSNISKKEINSGKEIIDKLSKLDPKLLPHSLKDIISDYKKFTQHDDKHGLWSSTKTKHKKFNQKYDKILLLLSGITAGGKDAIRQEMDKLYPNLFLKTVTATSRPKRDGEIHGKDYYFINSHKEFRQSIKNNELFEYIKRGDSFYGLPRKSLEDALKHPCPIICSQIELSSWSKIEKYIYNITEANILVVKIFIMPEMSFSEYKKWLAINRDDEMESRLNKTGWEIKKAAKKSHFILINKIEKTKKSLTKTAKSTADHLLSFLSSY